MYADDFSMPERDSNADVVAPWHGWMCDGTMFYVHLKHFISNSNTIFNCLSQQDPTSSSIQEMIIYSPRVCIGICGMDETSELNV